jgi:hypothetical protein
MADEVGGVFVLLAAEVPVCAVDDGEMLLSLR